jgi:hypothetical protein
MKVVKWPGIAVLFVIAVVVVGGMVGKDFEGRLANRKTLAEKS